MLRLQLSKGKARPGRKWTSPIAEGSLHSPQGPIAFALVVGAHRRVTVCRIVVSTRGRYRISAAHAGPPSQAVTAASVPFLPGLCWGGLPPAT
jgi:hypothetical protein